MNKDDREKFEKWCSTCSSYYGCNCVLARNPNRLEKLTLYRAKRRCAETSIDRVKAKGIIKLSIWVSCIETFFAMAKDMFKEDYIVDDIQVFFRKIDDRIS